jgi:hypothetical protein
MSLFENFKTKQLAPIQEKVSQALEKDPGSEDPGYSICTSDGGLL